MKTDSFTLLGTMIYEKGTFAFFEGTSSEYRKALKISDSIAGYKINSISTKEVELQSGDQAIKLPVGMQMKRLDEGEWSVAKPDGSAAGGSNGSGSGSRNAARSSSTTAAPATAEAESDALKRLLKKREEEK